VTLLAANSAHARDIASVLHPQTDARRHLEIGPRIMSRGSGVHVHDDSGRAFLEGAAGLWCASLGFSSDRLGEVAKRAMSRLGYYQIFRHASNEAAIDLSEKLLALAPVPMSKVLLQCSGSEANDTAVKLVWYHWNAQGRPQKRKIISRRKSYHGSTVASICLTGKPEFHAGFGLPFEGFLYADCPDWYRDRRDGETQLQFSQRMADDLEAMILAEGPETIAAFWADAVQGAAGALLPPEGYFGKIQAVLRKHDILFVADEVICGFGRTGRMWGCDTYAIEPDILTCAKALSAAMQPVSAVLVNDQVFQSVLTQSERIGRFVHGYTYAGHPVTSAVALETLRIYEEMDLLGHVAAMERVFLREFGALEEHPLVGQFTGTGLIGGLELVKDKVLREFFPAAAGVGRMVEEAALERGLILRLVGDRVAFSPPLVINEEELVEMARLMRLALDDVLAALPQA